jgi:hypothetical protein
MMQLVAVMWMMAIFFAIMGFLRGINREIISMSGIILALFALFQFDQYIRGVLLVNVPRSQVFFVQAGIFIAVVFFAYQSNMMGRLEAASAGNNNRGGGNAGRDSLQSSILGGILGLINGYLIWGSLWYFMDINQYPFAPYIIAPSPGSPSDQALNILPLVLLAGGPSGSGDLLALFVIVLFVLVLVIL